MTTVRYDHIIVGGGMAGWAAARALAEAAPDATVALLGEEGTAPYRRPLLSKGLWQDADEGELWLEVPATVVRPPRTRVVRLDPAERLVTDQRGDRFRYNTLLLATGGAPRTVWPEGERVRYFRTLDDYYALRALAVPGARVTVLGGGFIGWELAAALTGVGCAVTMVMPERGIGARLFPTDLSAAVVELYRDRGVTVLTDRMAVAVEERGREVHLRMTGGQTLVSDLLVAGLGLIPNVELARAAGLTLDDGIVVDGSLRTSNPSIFAAGDVARIRPAGLAGSLRAEHEDQALASGRAAGLSMAGQRRPYAHEPFFYSDLFDQGFEAVGHLDAMADTVADWKTPYREGVVYYLRAGLVTGVLLWNTWGQVDAARALLHQATPIGDPKTLRGRIAA